MQNQRTSEFRTEFESEEDFWNYVKKGIEEGEDDIRNGRVYDIEEAFRQLEEEFGI